MSNKVALERAPLRAVTSREQLTNDPEVDLNRTSVDLRVLLNDFDAANLGFATRADLPSIFEAVEEQGAQAIVESARKRLHALLNREWTTVANKSSAPPRAPTASQPELKSHIVANFGGEITLTEPNRWFNGPPILFETAGRVAECRYSVKINAGIDTNIIVQIRKLNSIAGCLIVNDLSATVENFNGVAVAGYWQMSFLHFNPKSKGPIKIELHQLQFKAH